MTGLRDGCTQEVVLALSHTTRAERDLIPVPVNLAMQARSKKASAATACPALTTARSAAQWDAACAVDLVAKTSQVVGTTAARGPLPTAVFCAANRSRPHASWTTVRALGAPTPVQVLLHEVSSRPERRSSIASLQLGGDPPKHLSPSCPEQTWLLYGATPFTRTSSPVI